ncbi:MAG: polyketide synthase dehydratase domain-containing protein [Pseudomonadota bacterium]
MNAQTVPLLRDHTFGEQAVLPTVSVMEWLVRAVEAERGLHRPFFIENYSLYKGVTLPSLDSELLLQADVDSQTDRVRCKLLSGNESGSVRYHYALDVVLNGELPDLTCAKIIINDGRRSVDKSDIYQSALFHGGLLQRIQRVASYNKDGMTALCRMTTDDVSQAVKGSYKLANPIADDLVLQVLILWPRLMQKISALPNRFKRWHYIRPVPLDQDFYIRLDVIESTSMRLVADLLVCSPQGHVYMKIESAEASLSPALNDLFLKKL